MTLKNTHKALLKIRKESLKDPKIIRLSLSDKLEKIPAFLKMYLPWIGPYFAIYIIKQKILPPGSIDPIESYSFVGDRALVELSFNYIQYIKRSFENITTTYAQQLRRENKSRRTYNAVRKKRGKPTRVLHDTRKEVKIKEYNLITSTFNLIQGFNANTKNNKKYEAKCQSFMNAGKMLNYGKRSSEDKLTWAFGNSLNKIINVKFAHSKARRSKI